MTPNMRQAYEAGYDMDVDSLDRRLPDLYWECAFGGAFFIPFI